MQIPREKSPIPLIDVDIYAPLGSGEGILTLFPTNASVLGGSTRCIRGMDFWPLMHYILSFYEPTGDQLVITQQGHSFFIHSTQFSYCCKVVPISFSNRLNLQISSQMFSFLMIGYHRVSQSLQCGVWRLHFEWNLTYLFSSSNMPLSLCSSLLISFW